MGQEELNHIHVIGDRVLVKPRKESERTESGLYLPLEFEKRKRYNMAMW